MSIRIGKVASCIFMTLTIILAFSSVLAGSVSAVDGGLNLPPTPVTIEVIDGIESYFETQIGDAPSGYDITNRTYLGWCIDTRIEMSRSPATHAVTLYSSFNPPVGLAAEEWDMVNYILNHKQGTVQDTQQAIWYFINMEGSYTPASAVAWTIINDALANGTGFVPENGQTIAIICYPTVPYPTQQDVQISIIEAATPTTMHDIAVTRVTLSTPHEYPGRVVDIEVEVTNKGEVGETFDVTVYRDSIPIETTHVTGLGVEENTTLVVHWNTSGLTPCHTWTIRADAPLPGDSHPEDNSLVGGGLKIKMIGDVDASGEVDIFDMVKGLLAYDSKPGDANWNPQIDIAAPFGFIDVFDLATIAYHYGERCG